MKKIITFALILAIAVPVVGYTASGIVEYQRVKLSKGSGSVVKLYDHDESVICYVYVGGGGISCVKD